MPTLTNRTRLCPGPAPDAPPWRWLDPRTVQRWLQVSVQTLVNWRARGTGPSYRIAVNGRVWYRLADVRTWIDGDPPEAAREMVLNYLRCNEHLWVLLGYGPKFSKELQGQGLALATKGIQGLETLSDRELETMCSIIDVGGSLGALPKRHRPKRFIENNSGRQFIGY